MTTHKGLGKKIAWGIGIASILCYVATYISWLMNGKQLLYSFEVVYFIGILATLYFLGYIVYVQSKKKAVRESTGLVVSSLVFLAILLFVYLIAAKHVALWDLTENKRYSLSDQTMKIVQGLDSDIEIIAFFKRDQRGKSEIEKTLEQYAYQSKKISYRFVDPQTDPVLAKEFGIENFGETVIKTKERTEKVDMPSEEDITSAIIRLVEDKKMTIGFLSGHNEPGLSDEGKNGFSIIRSHLERENYRTRDLLLMRESAVPSDIDCVVVAAPKSDIFQSELDALTKYYKDGGSMLVMVDPEAPRSLVTFLDSLGVEAKDGVIIDPLAQVLGASAVIPVISQYVPHAITNNFRAASFLPMARMVDVKATLPEGFTGNSLGYTGPGSWVEMDTASLKQQVEMNKDVDIPGPVSVMCVVEKAEASRMVVIGDSNFIDNTNIGLSGNKDLFMNTIAWLAHQENLISVREKVEDSKPMFLSGTMQLAVFFVPVLILPLTVIGIGVFVVFIRRRD